MDWISYILGIITLPILIAVLGVIYALLDLRVAGRTARTESLADPPDGAASPTPLGIRSTS